MLKSKLPEIIATSPAKVTAAVQRTAAKIVAGSMRRSRVRTGFMRSGWQMRTMEPYAITVFNLASYTIYNEYGTVHMSAQPMLRPSIEEVRLSFYKEVRGAWVLS